MRVYTSFNYKTRKFTLCVINGSKTGELPTHALRLAQLAASYALVPDTSMVWSSWMHTVCTSIQKSMLELLHYLWNFGFSTHSNTNKDTQDFKYKDTFYMIRLEDLHDPWQPWVFLYKETEKVKLFCLVTQRFWVLLFIAMWSSKWHIFVSWMATEKTFQVKAQKLVQKNDKDKVKKL